ncbi:small ribosomal subunit protein mS31 isoform X2 [Loxodonta africana]|uniref:small ribosomal subunit protein mS31 isoform X2 n=1 Tax=Loxodonta africana TaxID=9785 RepID=UPI000C813641|nr:28S ribosomal protein S31, mitochondrial isoform X2 [Loxodonta africana]
MFPRVSALLPLSHFSRLLLSSGSAEVPAAAVLLLAAPHGTVRTKNNIQRYFGINSVIYNKKDEQSFPTHETSQETSNSDNSVKENTKKDLINIIKGMKIGLSTVNVQTTKPPNRRPLKNLKTAIGRVQTATENTTKKRNEPLSPELLAAASAVAESLPFDKQTTKSELLRQLRRHEEDMRAQKEGRQQKVSLRRDIFKGKRLDIFDIKAAEEAPETETSPSIWDVEFAKQLATVNQQPFQNGFEEMIQWTKEGKLWEFPINNEAGFDDDDSEFHEHIFLDKYLENFPKQGPIRHFMELVTCGLSKNPYLSVKQKIEHIEWFRNYFNEKKDILKESDIQFN